MSADPSTRASRASAGQSGVGPGATSTARPSHHYTDRYTVLSIAFSGTEFVFADMLVWVMYNCFNLNCNLSPVIASMQNLKNTIWQVFCTRVKSQFKNQYKYIIRQQKQRNIFKITFKYYDKLLWKFPSILVLVKNRL